MRSENRCLFDRAAASFLLKPIREKQASGRDYKLIQCLQEDGEVSVSPTELFMFVCSLS